jgi:hypothetical protein
MADMDKHFLFANLVNDAKTEIVERLDYPTLISLSFVTGGHLSSYLPD